MCLVGRTERVCGKSIAVVQNEEAKDESARGNFALGCSPHHGRTYCLFRVKHQKQRNSGREGGMGGYLSQGRLF